MNVPVNAPVSDVEGAMTLDELRQLIQPLVMGDKAKGIKPEGSEVMKIANAHLPSDMQGQGIKALVGFPEKHASFKAAIEALGY